MGEINHVAKQLFTFCQQEVGIQMSVRSDSWDQVAGAGEHVGCLKRQSLQNVLEPDAPQGRQVPSSSQV